MLNEDVELDVVNNEDEEEEAEVDPDVLNEDVRLGVDVDKVVEDEAFELDEVDEPNRLDEGVGFDVDDELVEVLETNTVVMLADDVDPVIVAELVGELGVDDGGVADNEDGVKLDEMNVPVVDTELEVVEDDPLGVIEDTELDVVDDDKVVEALAVEIVEEVDGLTELETELEDDVPTEKEVADDVPELELPLLDPTVVVLCVLKELEEEDSELLLATVVKLDPLGEPVAPEDLVLPALEFADVVIDDEESVELPPPDELVLDMDEGDEEEVDVLENVELESVVAIDDDVVPVPLVTEDEKEFDELAVVEPIDVVAIEEVDELVPLVLDEVDGEEELEDVVTPDAGGIYDDADDGVFWEDVLPEKDEAADEIFCVSVDATVVLEGL